MDLSPPVLRGRGGRGRGRAVGRGRGRAVGRGRGRAVGRGRGRAVGRGRGRAVGALGRGVRGRGATVGPLSGRQCETPPSLPSSSDDSPTPSPPPLPRDKGTAHPNYGIVSPTSGSIDVVGGKWRKRVGTTALAHIYDGTPGIASPPPNVPSALELLDLVSVPFENEYIIHQECTIDEAMIPFKGRVGFKQYMKDKPIRWGIKVFVLADARNGYIRRFQVYRGKGIEGGNSTIGSCTRVVLELMAGYEDSGLNLYTDRFYTSPVLYKHLYNCGINACGTCLPNRSEFPSELRRLKATGDNRGTFETRCNGPLVATSW